MADLLRTKRTYATPERARQALAQILAPQVKLKDVRYLIAVCETTGRYAPVLVGNQYIAHALVANCTVVS